MLQIQWKTSRFTVDFSHLGPRWADHVTLGQLSLECSEKTGVPQERLKLLHSGGKDVCNSRQRGGEETKYDNVNWKTRRGEQILDC